MATSVVVPRAFLESIRLPQPDARRFWPPWPASATRVAARGLSAMTEPARVSVAATGARREPVAHRRAARRGRRLYNDSPMALRARRSKSTSSPHIEWAAPRPRSRGRLLALNGAPRATPAIHDPARGRSPMSRGRDGLWRAILPRGGSTRRPYEHVIKRRAVVRAVSANARRRVVRWTRLRQAADRAVDLRLTNRRGFVILVSYMPLAAGGARDFPGPRDITAPRSPH